MTAPEPSITLSLLDYIALEVKEYQETEGKDALFSINPNLLLDLCAAARRGVEADKELSDWNDLFLAVTMGDLPDAFKGMADVKRLWPNEWHQDCAMVAYTIKTLREGLAVAVRRETGLAEECVEAWGLLAYSSGEADCKYQEAVSRLAAIRARNDQRGPAAEVSDDADKQEPRLAPEQSGPRPTGES